MNEEKAKSVLKAYSRIYIETTRHCRERMLDRKVTIEDLRYIIEWGKIIELEMSPEFGGWKCKLHGTDIDGYELTFVAAIRENIVTCITVF